MAEETIKKVKVTLERKKGGPPMGYGRSKRKVGDNVYELGIGKITVVPEGDLKVLQDQEPFLKVLK